MRLEFLCKSCGKSITPVSITKDEAERLSGDSIFFRDYDGILCYSVETCSCQERTKAQIVKAVKVALDNI